MTANRTRPTEVCVEDHLASLPQRRADPAPERPTLESYLRSVPDQARERLTRLRSLVREELPESEEKLSYGVVGYVPAGQRRARVFVSGWKDHLGVYPVPGDEALAHELAPYRHGKGTLRFPLGEPLPEDLVRRTVRALASG